MNNPLGRWITREREKRGWSQSKLARESGISQAHISRIVNKSRGRDEQVCGAKTANALAQALGSSPAYVMKLAGILVSAPDRRGGNFSTWFIGELLTQFISQQELAEQSGVDLQTIRELTQGIPPSMEVLEAIGPVLNRSVDYLAEKAGLGGGTDLPAKSDFQLTKDELCLIEEYRQLDRKSKTLLADILQVISKTRTRAKVKTSPGSTS